MRLVKTALGVVILAIALGSAGFFLFVPGIVESQHNRVMRDAAPRADEAAVRLHDTLFVADMHADTLLWARSAARRSTRGHVDLPRLREGDVALQVFSAVTLVPSNINYDSNTPESDDLALLAFGQRWPRETWTSPYARALHQANRLAQLAAAEDDFMVVRNQADFAALSSRRDRGEAAIGGLLAIEGLHAIEGDLANLDGLIAAGYRMMGLQHFFDNRLGGSLHGANPGGLTEFGREVVAAMEAGAIIVDLAHAHPNVVDDVLAMATRPVVVSHTGFRGHCDSPRNIPDRYMQRIAEAGGLIGVGYWAGAVCDISLAGVASAIAYGIDLVGAEHVALGSDFDGAVTTSFDASELAALTDALLAEGVSEADIRLVMGENLRRFLAENLPEG